AVAAAAHPAIVCRAPVPASEAVLRAARDHGTAVFELAVGADWTRLADDVRAVAAAWSPGTGHTPRAEDLFALLDAASVLLDAPLVLEDTALAVLAWSGGQDEADEERVTGILERRAPGWLVEALEARGDFARLAASDEPLFLGPASAHAKPRMAVAVRFGGELLGYLWATTAGEPFGPERSADFAAVSGAVASFLRGRGAGSGADRPVVADLVSALLRGEDADGAARRLGVRTAKLTVLAARLATGGGPEGDWAGRRGLLGPLALHLTIGHPRAVTTFDGDAAYALLPWPPSLSAAAALAGTRRLAEGFARRAGRGRDLVLAVGGVASTPDEVPAAKDEADLVLRVLADRLAGPPVAAFADVQTTFAVSSAARALARAGHRLRGPVDLLAGHDAEQHTELVPTLRAYLDLFGDVKRAAERIHVHPNTFRNRLRRIRELTGFDATDPDARFLAELEFRIRGLRGH
ncbi:PucR family transcriptional regulator, partial [Amycolatopsis samaneae]|uniref:PucR family transcriptional regulator n=1 Tax=Amycolatopsis samaneae TaxID=664691 RepID=UPI00360A6B2D